jgi:hypothetical protein
MSAVLQINTVDPEIGKAVSSHRERKTAIIYVIGDLK